MEIEKQMNVLTEVLKDLKETPFSTIAIAVRNDVPQVVVTAVARLHAINLRSRRRVYHSNLPAELRDAVNREQSQKTEREFSRVAQRVNRTAILDDLQNTKLSATAIAAKHGVPPYIVRTVAFQNGIVCRTRPHHQAANLIAQRRAAHILEQVDRGKSYASIGRELGLSRERVRQIANKAKLAAVEEAAMLERRCHVLPASVLKPDCPQ